MLSVNNEREREREREARQEQTQVGLHLGSTGGAVNCERKRRGATRLTEIGLEVAEKVAKSVVANVYPSR